MVVVADNRYVVRYGTDGRIFFVYTFQVAFAVRTHVGVAAKAHVYGLVDFLYFPREAVDEPVIRQFYLLVVNDTLVEEPVLVPDAAAMARQLQGCQGVDETGCQTAEAAVAQTRVPFFRDDFIQVPAQILQAGTANIFHADADEVGLEQASQ